MGFPSIGNFCRIADKVKRIRNRPHKIKPAAIHPGVVAGGDCINAGVLLGSIEKSRQQVNLGLIPSGSQERNSNHKQVRLKGWYNGL